MTSGDLTRWNRAGLRRFRYIDGNAVTYLERLRQAMAEAYQDAETGQPIWSQTDIPSSETPRETEARWLAQYDAERRDYAWETLRSLARSTHVLTEHLDAYANETFLGTATQWDSLRMLVELLDYHPAPPASASTHLAFHAAEAGSLPAGFQVKNAPADGGPPAIFETSSDLTLEPVLSAIRPLDWDRSQEPFDYAPDSAVFTADFPLATAAEPPAAGSLAVLLIEDGDLASLAVRIESVTGTSLTLKGQATDDGNLLTAKRWQVSLLVEADKQQVPKLAGDQVLVLTPDHNLTSGRSVVTWLDVGTWQTARVEAVEGDRVRLSGSLVPVKDEDLFLLTRSDTQLVGGTRRVVLPIQRGAGGTVWRPDFTTYGSLQLQKEPVSDTDSTTLYEYVTATDFAFYLPEGSEPVATVVETEPSDLRLDGDPGDLTTGDWLVFADRRDAEGLSAHQVVSIDTGEDDYELVLDPLLPAFDGTLHMLFGRRLRPLDHDQNRESVFDPASRSDQSSTLPVALDSWPAALKVGRQVLVADGTQVHLATVTKADSAAGTIEIAPALPGSELTEPAPVPTMARADTTIYGNVTAADHGETKPAKTLGNGDATRSGQSFELAVTEVSFVADATMPAGVRAAVEVIVGPRTWSQVANLRDSAPADAHYEVRMTEAGMILLRFGDGRHGQRLPTGSNNVKAVYRKGVGESGNLPSGSLVKPVKPNRLVEAVWHPVEAAGGSDMETVASLREQAPAGLLTLERAVSLTDFANLAIQNASVWQAQAYRRRSGVGHRAQVHVVIVPAGGEMGTLQGEIEAFLRAHALPGVSVTVEPFVPLYLQLVVTLRVDAAAFEPEVVKDEVLAALAAAYDLKTAQLGAPLYRSQLLYLIEGVAGVENTAVSILPTTVADALEPPVVIEGRGGGIRSIRPRPNQMILHDPDHSTLTITTEAFAL